MTACDSEVKEIDPASVPPVDNEERLYRRLLPSSWYKRGRESPIPQVMFMPRKWVSDERPGDPDGISVNRALLTDVETAATRPDNQKKIPVAEFGVADVTGLGLSVEPKPLNVDRSHAVIPELNSLDRRDMVKEAQMDEWAHALRENAIIVYDPPK